MSTLLVPIVIIVVVGLLGYVSFDVDRCIRRSMSRPYDWKEDGL